MSALGQKQTWRTEIPMSALPPKADIAARQLNVRFVPKADSCSAAKNGQSIHLIKRQRAGTPRPRKHF
jgi:hypothetical protein